MQSNRENSELLVLEFVSLKTKNLIWAFLKPCIKVNYHINFLSWIVSISYLRHVITINNHDYYLWVFCCFSGEREKCFCWNQSRTEPCFCYELMQNKTIWEHHDNNNKKSSSILNKNEISNFIRVIRWIFLYLRIKRSERISFVRKTFFLFLQTNTPNLI